MSWQMIRPEKAKWREDFQADDDAEDNGILVVTKDGYIGRKKTVEVARLNRPWWEYGRRVRKGTGGDGSGMDGGGWGKKEKQKIEKNLRQPWNPNATSSPWSLTILSPTRTNTLQTVQSLQ